MFIKTRRQINVYRRPTKNGYRIYRIPDFCPRLPSEDFVLNINFTRDIKTVRSEYELYWCRAINRYVVYRYANGLYYMILIVDGPELSYRPYGEWVKKLLKIGDLTKGGSLGAKEVSRSLNLKIEKNEEEKQRDKQRKYNDMMREMNKDFDWLIKGRTSTMPGVIGPASANARKRSKKKIVIVGARTGKVLAIKELKKCSELTQGTMSNTLMGTT